jgi:hypothetical protein
VVEALRLGSARDVHRALGRELDARSYNPFHLLYADTTGDAFVTWFDGEAVRQERLGRGLSVVTERSLGGDDHGRSERIRGRLELVASGGTPPALEDLAPVMREHVEDDPIGSTCVHVPALRYGTRSSLLLQVHAPGGGARWLWSEGPPCATPYAELRLGVTPTSTTASR